MTLPMILAPAETAARTPAPYCPGDAPSQSWTRDYRDLFALHPDNTFLIKVAYWMSR